MVGAKANAAMALAPLFERAPVRPGQWRMGQLHLEVTVSQVPVRNYEGATGWALAHSTVTSSRRIVATKRVIEKKMATAVRP